MSKSWLFVLLGACALTFAGQPAEACHNGYEPRINPKVGGVAQAERAVSEGHPGQALAAVTSLYPGLVSRKLGPDPLLDRALLVAARAVVRSDGEAPLALPDEGKPSSDRTLRERRLDWALTILRAQSLRTPSDPSSATDLGEALERFPEHRAEARRLLGDLEARDVLASGQAHASLARLRRSRGAGLAPWAKAPLAALESASVELELARCRARVKAPDGCKLEPGAS